MTSLRCSLSLISAAALFAIQGSCDGGSGPNPARVDTLITSDPSTTVALHAASRVGALVIGDFAYVAVPPQTFAMAGRARVRGGGGIETNSVLVGGGLDPVAALANDGDSLTVVFTTSLGAEIASFKAAVPAARRPRVVRTVPPRKKTDVPLNARIIIVFNEPVDGTTLNGQTIRLMQGSTPVAGTVRFLDASQDATGIRVEFVPASALQPSTDYQLIVADGVRDRDGEFLEAEEVVAFTTGVALTGPPARIDVVPDSLRLPVGSSYQVTATVFDAAGNAITDQQIQWLKNGADSTALSVTQTGRLTALATGFMQVIARVGNVSATLYVTMTASPTAATRVGRPHP